MKKKNSCIDSIFCKKLEVDLGFQYIEAFCRAVEAYSDSLEIFVPGIFEYRGACLRYAFERYLYFVFVDNTRLYSFFNEWKNGRLPPFDEATAGMERNLALCICGKKLTPEDITIKFKQRVNLSSLFLCGRLLIWQWSYSCLGRFFATPESQNNNRAEVLIYIPSEKFVRYFSPISRMLPFSFSYFIDSSNSQLVDFFINLKLPFIDSRRLNISLRNRQKKYLPEGLIMPRHLVFWYDCLHESLKVLKPSCVIVSEGNAPGDELMNQACKELSIPVICVQQGWPFIFHNGFRNMSFTKMLTWGEGFSKLFQPCNPKQNFVAVGDHMVGPKSVGVKEDVSLAAKAVSFFLQMPARIINEECWNEFFKLIIWTATEFRHLPVIVREHPSSAPLPGQLRKELEKYPNIKVKSNNEYSLMDTLSESQLSLSICSSTIFESIAVGVLPIIFNMTTIPKLFPEIVDAGAGLEVKSPQAAKDVISRCLTDKSFLKQFDAGMKLFQERYFYKNDGEAVDRIAQEIVSTVKS